MKHSQGAVLEHLFTRRLPDGRLQRRPRETFTYRFAVPGTFAAGATATERIQILADVDFIWTKLEYFALVSPVPLANTHANRVVPLITMRLTDQNDRRYFRAPEPVPNLCGYGETPFILPMPLVLSATTILTAEFVSFDTAVGYERFSVSVIGYHLWPWVNDDAA